MPSPKQLAWLIVKAPETRSIEEANAILQISQDRDAAILIRIVRRFVDLVRRVGTKAHDAGPVFDDWLLGAKRCGLRPVETFAAGLQHDGDAVRAALETSWSSAQVEGQVNKLKLLKRSMYGRGNLELLRRRLILAP
ncbi:transposase [Aurantimonas sp. C2-6-R+9]|uniref:transposase n=1 Tax=Aurantimonas sp. C2-6-R+9 TaxID=3114365 RepID=UPI002E185D9A|nr:transposase [Aurantimonas sp. C2-6-R+9]